MPALSAACAVVCPGAGDATYTVAAEDTGRSLACRVTAVGSDGGIAVATSAVVIAA